MPIAARRLENQRITRPRRGGPADVFRWRFEPGELDPYIPNLHALPPDEPF